MSNLPLWLLPYSARRRFVGWLADRALKRGRATVIHIDGVPYLERYAVYEGRGGRAVFLHRFLRPDDDRGVHNHPYAWATSVILTGGYVEQRYASVTGPVESGQRSHGRYDAKIYLTGDLNRLPDGDTFHRVAHLLDARSALSRGTFEPEVWTLFIAGPKHGASWGYLVGGYYEPKREVGGCLGCPAGAAGCTEHNYGTDEIPIYLSQAQPNGVTRGRRMMYQRP